MARSDQTWMGILIWSMQLEVAEAVEIVQEDPTGHRRLALYPVEGTTRAVYQEAVSAQPQRRRQYCAVWVLELQQ